MLRPPFLSRSAIKFLLAAFQGSWSLVGRSLPFPHLLHPSFPICLYISWHAIYLCTRPPLGHQDTRLAICDQSTRPSTRTTIKTCLDIQTITAHHGLCSAPRVSVLQRPTCSDVPPAYLLPVRTELRQPAWLSGGKAKEHSQQPTAPAKAADHGWSSAIRNVGEPVERSVWTVWRGEHPVNEEDTDTAGQLASFDTIAEFLSQQRDPMQSITEPDPGLVTDHSAFRLLFFPDSRLQLSHLEHELSYIFCVFRQPVGIA